MRWSLRARRCLALGCVVLASAGALPAAPASAQTVLNQQAPPPEPGEETPSPKPKPDKAPEPTQKPDKAPEPPKKPKPTPAPDESGSDAPADGGGDDASAGSPDSGGTLGDRGQFCGRKEIRRAPAEGDSAALARARSSCETSGSIAHPYPIERYGLDTQIDFDDVDDLDNGVDAALQGVGSLAWTGLINVVHGVLLLLEWAFSLNLLSDGLASVRNGLNVLSTTIFGSSWLRAAIVIAGLSAAWTGLVMRRFSQSLGGLAASAALFAVALLIINKPDATVVRVANVANDASLSMMSVAARGEFNDPVRGYAEASQGLFDQLVLRPWCALQFQSVDYCLKKPEKGNGDSVADAWLAFAPDSGARTNVYKLTSGELKEPSFLDKVDMWAGRLGWSPVDPDEGGGYGPDWAKERYWREPRSREKILKKLGDFVQSSAAEKKRKHYVSIQTEESTFSRLGLLALIVFGLIGALLVLLYLAIRLLVAGVMALLFTLVMPAMLMAAAFGESGRATFVGYGKRFFGALIGKLVYSLLLALVLLVARVLAELQPTAYSGVIAAAPLGSGGTTAAADGIGWWPLWMVQCAYWWGLFFKRRDIFAWVSLDTKVTTAGGLNMGGQQSGSPMPLANLYYGMRAVRDVTRAATAVPRGALKAGRRAYMQDAMSRSDMLRDKAKQELGLHARRAIGAERAGELDHARNLLGQQAKDKTRLSRVQGRRGQVERELARGGHSAKEHRKLEGSLRRLHARDDMLGQRLSSPEYARAHSVVTRWGDGIPEATEQEVEAWSASRARDIEARPADAPQNLRAAGVDYEQFARAAPAQQAAWREQSQRTMDRHRELLRRLEEPRASDAPPLRRDVRSAGMRESARLGARRADERLVETGRGKQRANRRHDRAARRNNLR